MRRSLVTAVATALLLVAGCSGPDDEPVPKASATTEPVDPRAEVLAEIDDLPTVDLGDLELPDAADGFTQGDADAYAEDVAELMDDSLTEESWWTADPSKGTIADFMADLPRETREATLADDYANGENPVAQFMVSIFAEDAQPVAPPRVVKAAWDVAAVTPEGGGAPFQRVRLGVQAVYRVGEDERPVLVRRELALNGVGDSVPGSWPGFGYYSVITGVESCPLYEDGVYAPLTRPSDDLAAYEAFLEDARAKGFTAIDVEVEKDNDLDEKRETSCGDRSES